MYYYSIFFAQLYGRGLYGRATYSCTVEQKASGLCDTTTSNGLVNTGIAVTGFVTLACIIIFLTLVLRVWRRKRTNNQANPKQANDSIASSSDRREN